MKPLNYDENGCDPISSNCVIWQGPDIACLNLCKGDTISDVTNKLATEVCAIIESLNPVTYQEALEAFDLGIGAGAPETFEQMMGWVLGRIHNLEECTGCTPDCDGNSELVLPEEVSTDCCSTLMEIAQCFYYENELHQQMTEMTLSNYVTAIGNFICEIEQTLNANDIVIADHGFRLRTLETAPPPTFTEPEVVSTRFFPGISTPTSDIVEAMEQEYDQLITATGDANAILNKIAVPNEILLGDQLATPSLPNTALTGWEDPTDLSKAVGDIWAVLGDHRKAIQNSLACCPEPCEAFELKINAALDGQYLRIWFIGDVPPGWDTCDPAGVMLTITDTDNHVFRHRVYWPPYVVSGGYYSIDLDTTPLNQALNFRIEGTACITDTNSTCEKYISYELVNTAECPKLTLSSASKTVNYWVLTHVGTHTYTVELWDKDRAVLIASQSFISTAKLSYPGTFGNLDDETTYRVAVSVTTGGNTVTCPDQLITTPAAACLIATAPSASVATI